MTNKTLYKVSLNWYGEVQTYWTHAPTEKQALTNAIKQLSNKMKVNLTICRAKILSGHDCWKVKENKNE